MLKFEAKDLAAALSPVVAVVASKSDTAILSHIRLSDSEGLLSLLGTNLDQWVSSCLAFSGEVPDVCVPRWFLENCAKAGDVLIGLEFLNNGTARASFGRTRITAPTMPADDFPVWEPNLGEAIDVPAQLVRQSLEACGAVASREASRVYLNGVYLHGGKDGGHFVATDGHQAMHSPVSDVAYAGKGIIIPSVTVNLFAKALGKADRAQLATSDNCVQLTVGHTVIMSKLVVGEFPDYQRFIPQGGEFQAEIEAASALDVLERIRRGVASAGSEQVHFLPTQDGLHVGRGDLISDFIPATMRYDMEPFFANAAYVETVIRNLHALGVKRVALFNNSALEPVKFFSTDHRATAIVLPMNGMSCPPVSDDATREAT